MLIGATCIALFEWLRGNALDLGTRKADVPKLSFAHRAQLLERHATATPRGKRFCPRSRVPRSRAQDKRQIKQACNQETALIQGIYLEAPDWPKSKKSYVDRIATLRLSCDFFVAGYVTAEMRADMLR